MEEVAQVVAVGNQCSENKNPFFFFLGHVSGLFRACLMCIWVYLASVPLFVPDPRDVVPNCTEAVLTFSLLRN